MNQLPVTITWGWTGTNPDGFAYKLTSQGGFIISLNTLSGDARNASEMLQPGLYHLEFWSRVLQIESKHITSDFYVY